MAFSLVAAEVLSEDGHSWVGIDISPSMLEIAVEREVEGDVLLGDMGQGFGFRAGMFDGAIRYVWVEDSPIPAWFPSATPR